MAMQRWWPVAAVLVLASMGVCPGVAQAQTPGVAADTPGLIVKGEVMQELRLTAADLKAIARVKVTAKDHDGMATRI